MTGVLSGLALVGAFGALAGLGTILAARLYRAGSAGPPKIRARRTTTPAPVHEGQPWRHR